MKNIAVVLAGCGFLDGAEIRESVLTLLALDNAGAQYQIFAPDKDQYHVINHLKGKEVSGTTRNVLEESARIARGEIQDIVNLHTDDFDALILPGGFGVAKNFCSFAFDGSNAHVDEQVAGKLKAFNSANKPIGAICISPALVALSLQAQQTTLTIGNDQASAAELVKLGAKHQNCVTSDCVVDEVHKIVTTPAYMDDKAKIADVYTGISKLVNNVIRLAD